MPEGAHVSGCVFWFVVVCCTVGLRWGGMKEALMRPGRGERGQDFVGAGFVINHYNIKIFYVR